MRATGQLDRPVVCGGADSYYRNNQSMLATLDVEVAKTRQASIENVYAMKE